MSQNLGREYTKFVSQNILGMLGISIYILADTFYISKAAGSNGITVLNLCLPLYNLIYAIGSMIGIGSATRFTILKAQRDSGCDRFFSNAVFCCLIISIPFILIGALSPDGILRIMGGDADIASLGVPYARIFLMFAPFFMINFIINAFVRNDGAPSLAMAATLAGSFFNIIFDYIFMFPMGMGGRCSTCNRPLTNCQYLHLRDPLFKERQSDSFSVAATVTKTAVSGMPAWNLRIYR